jgi:hypothetical protein
VGPPEKLAKNRLGEQKSTVLSTLFAVSDNKEVFCDFSTAGTFGVPPLPPQPHPHY